MEKNLKKLKKVMKRKAQRRPKGGQSGNKDGQTGALGGKTGAQGTPKEAFWRQKLIKIRFLQILVRNLVTKWILLNSRFYLSKSIDFEDSERPEIDIF